MEVKLLACDQCRKLLVTGEFQVKFLEARISVWPAWYGHFCDAACFVGYCVAGKLPSRHLEIAWQARSEVPLEENADLRTTEDL